MRGVGGEGYGGLGEQRQQLSAGRRNMVPRMAYDAVL